MLEMARNSFPVNLETDYGDQAVLRKAVDKASASLTAGKVTQNFRRSLVTSKNSSVDSLGFARGFFCSFGRAVAGRGGMSTVLVTAGNAAGVRL